MLPRAGTKNGAGLLAAFWQDESNLTKAFARMA
jgi:hypothetical protein